MEPRVISDVINSTTKKENEVTSGYTAVLDALQTNINNYNNAANNAYVQNELDELAIRNATNEFGNVVLNGSNLYLAEKLIGYELRTVYTEVEYENDAFTSGKAYVYVPIPDRSSSSGTFDESVANNMVEKSNDNAQSSADYEAAQRLRSGESLMGVDIQRYSYVHGLPFQFTGITDRRRTASNNVEDLYGRTFATDIVANTPIVSLMPGVPKFLTSDNIFEISDSDRNLVLGQLISGASGAIEEIAEGTNVTGSDVKFFGFEPTPTAYYEYVNSYCSASAKHLGIGQRKMPTGVKCENVNWAQFNRDVDGKAILSDVLGGVQSLDNMAPTFSFDPLSSITESYSNSIRPASIEGQMKGFSDTAKDFNFLFGAGWGGERFLEESAETIEDLIPDIGALDTNNPNNIVNRLSLAGKTVLSGSNLKFPQIYDSSDSSAGSYTLEMRFVSPYDTPFCKWRYVLVPFWHLWCLMMPRSVTPNTYQSPFIIRPYSKGYFNIEMAMMESLTVKKYGDGTMISSDGVPTMIEVSASFKSLYTSMAMSSFSDLGNFFANTGSIELLGTMSGVPMNRTGLDSYLSMLLLGSYEDVVNTPGNWMSKIYTRVLDTFGLM